MNSDQNHKQIPPKPPDITRNFASLFKKNSTSVNTGLGSVIGMGSSVNLSGGDELCVMPPSIPSNSQTSSVLNIPSIPTITHFPSIIQFPTSVRNPSNSHSTSNQTTFIGQIPLSGGEKVIETDGSKLQNIPGSETNVMASAKDLPGVSNVNVKKVVYNNGEPGIYWTSEETQELSSKFQQALIGKCAYGKPSLGVIREFIITRWNPRGDFQVGILDPRHILIRFELYEDYVHTWLKDATYIEGFLFRFFKWFPEFLPGIEPPVVPVWVSLPGLPIHLFNVNSLRDILSCWSYFGY